MRINESGDFTEKSQNTEVRSCSAAPHLSLSGLKTVTALCLSWEEVGKLAEQMLQNFLKIKISCRAVLSDWEYWDIQFTDRKLLLEELERIFEVFYITDEDRVETICYNGNNPINSIGMMLSEKLLKAALNGDWKETYCSNALWLLDFKYKTKENVNGD